MNRPLSLTPNMPGPSIEIFQIDLLRHIVKTPCGLSWIGITASEDLPIQVRRGLAHAGRCEQCLAGAAPHAGGGES